jgi:2-oxo-4-hydroxy-4-carboxy-5-ureidoimidazoline decarboxylase
MTLLELDRTALLECCGSSNWVDRMFARSPFGSFEQLSQDADEVWWALDESDWQEAFSKHPQIGARGAVSAWSQQEQAGMDEATPAAAESMRYLNREYFEKFGWIFITCATGKSAGEMRAEIERRLINTPADEIRIAAGEQAKIMQIRLRKLLES